MSAMLPDPRQRLRRLADDCEELARRPINADAKSYYWRAANDARQAMTARHVNDAGLCAVLAMVEAQAQFARWCAGEADDAAQPCEAVALPATPPRHGNALNARQLAALFGLSERGARKAIERGASKGLAGFHRDGRNLFAERDAFAEFRICAR
jgi:hypothetical protein